MSKKVQSSAHQSVEAAGATVNEAIQIALQLLQASREAVDIRILCEEDKGLFGMKGARMAKVRATLKRASSMTQPKEKH